VKFVSETSKKLAWKRLELASIAAARKEYLQSTPGRRVEEQIELSWELTRLAARRSHSR